ncbi:Uu.00g041260.m01.CDS01 [Anthostomella pinea]|uniref:Uu.00g041260.m01.CDS01 n=1 Tax=Anthostomella pinea TaxID=933095 RepID=A0AAI8YE53_9PEZI|nr:Uu.00g041260.m01.CDS01 [Anthostomella pinea]
MTTKPSDAPWADEPFKLIATPSKRLDDHHAYVHCASEMTHSHNVIIRGLNAIIQQAPHVPDSTDPSYNAQDVNDLLFYTQSWAKMLAQHHSVEETYIFPDLKKLSGDSFMMDDALHQHELFHDGLEKLLAYVSSTEPGDYRRDAPGGMKDIIDSFSKDLTDHLYAEIDEILGMGNLDSAGLRQVWDQAEKVAKANGNLGMLYDVFPCVLGCADKTCEGGNTFPPLPGVVLYAVKYWFASGNGAWRFNPCDLWGQPRPLTFVPQ